MIKIYHKYASAFEQKVNVIRLDSGINFVRINVARDVFVIRFILCLKKVRVFKSRGFAKTMTFHPMTLKKSWF